MTNDAQRYRALCLGNEAAFDFLCHWGVVAHGIDDIIDGDRKTAEEILSVFAGVFMLTSHPFYLANLAHLRGVLLAVTNMYADSVAFEKSGEEWKRQFANCYRHCGNELVFAVAQIVGGYDHARKFSIEQREICRANQEPIDVKGA